MVDGQVEAAIEEECGAIRAIQLRYGLAPFDTPRVARDRDDVLEDDVLGQQVEEVLTVCQPGHAFPDDAEERVQGPEVGEFPTAVIGRRPWSGRLLPGRRIAWVRPGRASRPGPALRTSV